MNGATKEGFFVAGKEHQRREARMREGAYSLFRDVTREVFIGPDYAYLEGNLDSSHSHQRRATAAKTEMSFFRFVDYFFGHNDADEEPTSTWEYAKYGATRAFRTIHNIAKLPILALGLIDRGFQQLDVSLEQYSEKLWENNHGVLSFIVGTIGLLPRLVSKAAKVGFLVASAAIDWENSYTRAKMRDQEGWTGDKPSNRFGWRILSVLTTGIVLAGATVLSGGLAAVGALTGLGLAGSAAASGTAIGATLVVTNGNTGTVLGFIKRGLFATGRAHKERNRNIKNGEYSVFGDVLREIFIGPDHTHLKALEQHQFSHDPALQKRIKAAKQPLTFGRVISYVFGRNDGDKPAETTWEYIKRGTSRTFRTLHNVLRLVTVFPLGLIDRGCQKLDVKLMQTSKKLWDSNHGFFSFLVGTAALLPRIVSKAAKVGFLVTSAAVEWNNSFKRAEIRDKETGTGFFWRAASVVTSFMSWIAASVLTGGGAAIPGAVGALGVAGSVIPGAANIVGAIPTATISVPSITIPGASTNAVSLGHLATPAAKISSSSIILGTLPPVVGGACHGVKKLTTSEKKPPVTNTMNDIVRLHAHPCPTAFNPPSDDNEEEEGYTYTRISSSSI